MTRYRCRLLASVPLALVCILAGCSSAPPLDLATMTQEWVRYMQKDYVLRPGDRVVVNVYLEDDLTQEITLSPQGTVTLKRVQGGIRAVGTTVESFRDRVERAYVEVLGTEAEVTVSLVEATTQSVYVTGEVGNSGVIPYSQGLTATQAIAASGGLLATAAWSDVRILRAPGSPRDRTQRLDVAGVLHHGHPDFILLPGDVVYCRPSGIANVGTFLNLWVYRLLPLQGGAIPTVTF